MTLRPSPLFGEDALPDDIAQTLQEGSRKFSAIAYLMLGKAETWDAALDELAMVQHAFARNDIDLALLDPLFTIMYERLPVLPNGIERFERLMAKLALPSPGIAARLRAEIAMTPEQRQKRNNKEWLDDYHATRVVGEGGGQTNEQSVRED